MDILLIRETDLIVLLQLQILPENIIGWDDIKRGEKMKKKTMLILSSLILILSGCSVKETVQTSPSYFEPILQNMEAQWAQADGGTWGLAGKVSETFRGVALNNGGREENGVFTCYIEYDPDAEGEYFTFDGKEQFTGTEEWNWSSIGVFHEEGEDKTYICWEDFNMGNARNPHFLLIEFTTDKPEEYQLIPCAVGADENWWESGSYRIGNKIYMADDNELAVVNLETKEFRSCREEYAVMKEYAKEKVGEKDLGMCQFGVILEQDDVTVYSAWISEGNDVPPVGMIFAAFQDNLPIAYMSVDFMVDELAEGLEIEAVE